MISRSQWLVTNNNLFKKSLREGTDTQLRYLYSRPTDRLTEKQRENYRNLKETGMLENRKVLGTKGRIETSFLLMK